jgi:colicin import membrane protein
MKSSLTSSVLLHVVVIGLGLVSLSSPRPMEVADVDALPIDIVPIEELTQVQEGDKKAPMAEKPAPKPTERPDPVENAQKIGENTVDTDAAPTPTPRPKEVKTAEATAPAPKPVEKPKPEETPKPKEEPKPTPATEVAPTPTPKEEVKPDPVKTADVRPTPEPEKPDEVAEAINEVAELPAEPEVKLPDQAPAPEARPQPAQAQSAKAPDRKDSEKPVKEAASKPQSEDKQALEDEVAALLNKEKASGGGAKRSQQQAALGGKKTTGAGKLTQSEMDALRGQIQKCWVIPAGAENAEGLRVSVKFRLTPAGEVEGRPEVVEGGGADGVERAAADAAKRAVSRCAPYNLPAEKYETWADVTVNFDPTEMF